MDVIGLAPKSKTGEYFRNNVWWWRPLWEYCLSVDPTLEFRVPYGQSNDGDGLKDPTEAEALGRTLLMNIESGETEQWQQNYRLEQSELPLQECRLCQGSGIRPDDEYVQGQDKKELKPEQAALYDRTHGWCNGCDGAGATPHWGTNYPFEVENVREFANFLVDSGGFAIG
jgi:hypothetical protein